jgi:hypothetical protein
MDPALAEYRVYAIGGDGHIVSRARWLPQHYP